MTLGVIDYFIPVDFEKKKDLIFPDGYTYSKSGGGEGEKKQKW